MKKVDALDQFNKSGMSYSDMMKNCQIYSAGIRTEETLLAKNLYGNLRRHGLLEEVRPKVEATEPLVDGIPYSTILKLRKEYVQGLRKEDTKHANAIYQQMLRRGWHTGLRLRCKAITKRDGVKG
ncbi:TPA: hypothetical protein JIZ13_03720 [Acinetobacter nosocomialis]|nr:hypothetical protein [Acinetobacter nosocomialis]